MKIGPISNITFGHKLPPQGGILVKQDIYDDLEKQMGYHKKLKRKQIRKF